jgi:ABC-type transport system substrate-binding protein
MGPIRRWMLSSVCFIASVVLILPLMAALPMTHAAEGEAKADRLIMGLINPYHDYVRPWINGTADHNIQHDPMLEWLFEIDAETGQFSPWLAKSWELAPDGKSWRIQLQEGVQFHHGYGEFTAKDVIQPCAMV